MIAKKPAPKICPIPSVLTELLMEKNFQIASAPFPTSYTKPFFGRLALDPARGLVLSPRRFGAAFVVCLYQRAVKMAHQ